MCQKLKEKLIEWIEKNGPMPLDVFWEKTQLDSEEGYYQRQEKQGLGKDFITAPAVSQLFGEILGVWLVRQWQSLNMPSKFYLVELGPGHGIMMTDVLRTLQKFPLMYHGMHLILLEPSSFLRQKQKKALEVCACPITWVQNIQEVESVAAKQHAPMLICGNEFLDALPILQYEKTRDGWKERKIIWDSDKGFLWKLVPLSEKWNTDFPVKSKVGDIVEKSPLRLKSVEQLIHLIKKYTGALWFCDYGPEGAAQGDTLQGLHRGNFSNPLDHVGLTDITSHVYFDELLQCFRHHQLMTWGPRPQNIFLKENGIDARFEMLKQKITGEQKTTLESQYQRLTDPQQMGTLFKVITGTYMG